MTSSSASPTLEQVGDAITAAAQSKRWVVEKIEEGHIVATVHVRQHTAIVDINYSPSTYSITYKDSRILRYDGVNIHRNYNKWVKLLDQAIRQRLNTL